MRLQATETTPLHSRHSPSSSSSLNMTESEIIIPNRSMRDIDDGASGVDLLLRRAHTKRQSLYTLESPITGTPAPFTSRQRCEKLLDAHIFHLVIIALVITDLVIVIAELCITLLDPSGHIVPHEVHTALSALSLTILSLFIVEVSLHIYVHSFRYLLSLTHLLDATVILVAFVLEIVLRGVAQELAGLLVLARFWRILRLMDAVALTVAMRVGARLDEAEKRCRELEAEVDRLRRQVAELLQNVPCQ